MRKGKGRFNHEQAQMPQLLRQHATSAADANSGSKAGNCHLHHNICPAGLPSDEALDATELRFLEDFCNLLTTAHYRLLSEEEWQTATDEEFTASYYSFGCGP